jgi:hypothetical protein
MSHAALVNGALFGFVILTLLRVLFIYAVIAMSAEDAVPAGPPALKLPAPPLRPLPVRRPRAGAPPDDAGSQPSDAGYAPRHADAALPAQNGIHPPQVPGAPQWDPAPNGDHGIHRPKVSGGPPWEPAPKPPWLDQ